METEEEKKQESYNEAISKTFKIEAIKAFFYASLLGMSIAAFIAILPSSNPEGQMYTQKSTIKELMRNTIKNGGDLDVIKHIYNTRSSKGLLWPFYDRKEDYYLYDYPLSGILNDLKVDYLQDSKGKDSVYYAVLCNIISENDKQNPFDNLEDNQKYSFESILAKLDTTYVIIKPDVVKIAEELNNKNQLVNKYLNKSDWSFYISISALIITIFLSLYQIYQNYSTSKAIRNLCSKSTKV